MGRLTGRIAPIYFRHLDGRLDGTDGDGVGSFELYHAINNDAHI